MKLILLVLGIVVIALNLFLWYSKKQGGAANADKSTANIKKSDGSETASTEFLNTPKADELKQAAAAELGISVEKLGRMSTDEIAILAAEKGLI